MKTFAMRGVVSFGLMSTAVGCAEDDGRAGSAPGLADDDLIRQIDEGVDLRNAIIELPEAGEAEVLYAVVDGRAMWTGDIVLGDPDELDQGFRGATLTGALWPAKTLKYRYTQSVNDQAKAALVQAMADWEAQTSIRFVEADAADTGGFVRITGDQDGCFAYLGYPGAGDTHQLNLGSGCEYSGVARHELGHALGLFHEQTRSDRDEHIDIDWNNIEPGQASQFDKYTKTGYAGKDRGSYDYDSVMHYGSDAFAIDVNKPVMTKKDGGLITRGAETPISAGDVAAIEALYAGEDNAGDDPNANGGGDVVPGSCQNQCGSAAGVATAEGGECYCDAGCVEYGDCCGDQAAVCGAGNGNGDGNGDANNGGAPSCSGQCGQATGQADANGQECYCDELCTGNGDCCGDYAASCGGGDAGNGNDGGGNPAGSCVGFCGGAGSQGESCYCDSECAANGDCCTDYAGTCGGGDNGGGGAASCAGKCGSDQDAGGCFCDPTCAEYGDCCDDYAAQCG
jgi:hypothetical protein